ncbi:glycoside hydrolase, partial [Tenacibaculum sp.]|nr:glycoside hydrolase [Tenacibaculum sp.]
NADNVSEGVNLKNQSVALKAMYNQFWKEKWFAGGFLWKWFHNYSEVGGSQNNRFTPQNKPAELIIKKAYEE